MTKQMKKSEVVEAILVRTTDGVRKCKKVSFITLDLKYPAAR